MRNEMLLPEELHERRFDDWNYLVRGLMEVWELSRLLGMERELEQLLAQDRGGALTDRLARMGNECGTLANLLSLRMRWPVGGPPPRLVIPLDVPGEGVPLLPGYHAAQPFLWAFPQDGGAAASA
jgi:hypothetical protein